MKSAVTLLVLLALYSIDYEHSPTIINEGKRPNILILLADDLGYGEIGSYGQQIIQTPELDELASLGMRFTNFYSGNAVCSPSRAVLMTGKSSSFSTIRGNNGSFSNDRWMRVALKKEELTLAEMLKEAGYQTGFVGKWHLDDPNDVSTWAYNRGFDFAVQEQWSSRFGGIDYDEDMHWINGKQDSVYYHVDEWECKDEFRTQLAFNYLSRIDKEMPFFLIMSYRAPHGHERRIGNQELYKDQGWPAKERLHAAKITLLDKQIGRLLGKLEQMGELENTLIFFTSDNGPHHEGHDHEFFNSNGELKGYKRDLYEGGIRVPLIVYWKGIVESGTINHRICGFQDLMPTIAEVAGINTPEQSNGISILPVLAGETQVEYEFLNWEFQLDGWRRTLPEGGFRQSVRMNKWKGVRYGLNNQIELYNLDIDVSESNNVAESYPGIIQKMKELMEDSRAETEGFPYGGVIQNYKAAEQHHLK
jgi:arylsulfatase A-like enzyme